MCSDNDDNEEEKVSIEGRSHSVLSIGNDGNDEEKVLSETEIISDDNDQTSDASGRKEAHDHNHTLEKDFDEEHRR